MFAPVASAASPEAVIVGAVASSTTGTASTFTVTVSMLSHTSREVPTQSSVSRSSTVFRPGVANAVTTLTPSPSLSPRRVPFKNVHVSRQDTVHGVVDV